MSVAGALLARDDDDQCIDDYNYDYNGLPQDYPSASKQQKHQCPPDSSSRVHAQPAKNHLMGHFV